MSPRFLTLVVATSMVLAACTSASDDSTDPDRSATTTTTTTVESTSPPTSATVSPSGELVASDGRVFAPAPSVDTGPTDPALVADLDILVASIAAEVSVEQVEAVAAHGDARVSWIFSDFLRFIQSGPVADALAGGFSDLTGVSVSFSPFGTAWGDVTDHLIAWDLPAIDEYADYKGQLFTFVEPGWEPLFADTGATIDWRLVSWGGVFIDDRPLGAIEGCPRGCIPSIDDPAVTDAAGGDWYPDESVVFGVVVGDEARAYPKNIMEVHEMVNDTLGGRRIGIPYCTLCGSAQAYLTDSVADGIEIPVLRTSGLLSRSNKVMYDLVSKSVFDTFTGEAITGPLREAGVTLEQISVVTSTWGAWKDQHPDTTIVAEDGGIGRIYPENPLGGRDDNGPIFPVGDVDPRFDAHTAVIGVIGPDGTPIAFNVGEAELAIRAGETVTAGGVTLSSDGTGFRAADQSGGELTAHQAFWFAWTQFHPDTIVWSG